MDCSARVISQGWIPQLIISEFQRWCKSISWCIVIWNNLCLLTCGRTFISPNGPQTSCHPLRVKKKETVALKVNFVRLHGSINVTTHVLEGFLICPFWYASSGHGCFALKLYLSSSHHLNFLLVRPSRIGGSSFNGPGWWCGPAQLCTSSYDELQVEIFNWWSSFWLRL